MVPISSLWLPILVSGVIVFIASSIIHALLPYHRSDYGRVPSEDEVMAALRGFQISPGDYEIPYAATPKERGGQEFVEKTENGPNALLTMVDGKPNMGKLLGQWFLYCLVVCILTAYIAGLSLSPGAGFMKILRLAGSAAFAGFSAGLWPN